MLTAALHRHQPEIRRTFRSAIGGDPFAGNGHVARIQVAVEDAADGGKFSFGATSSEEVWDLRHQGARPPGFEPGMRFTRIAPHDRASRDERDTVRIHFGR
ncbi:hypothetical protein [Streptomyces orinoci]|uniref:Uncharacterized protein n=1 Tax=Streptomyces orinoci TaxID=67339 RepID=A0ABV3K0F9_STRON|nr:hypothetical protein [Streptomyces orinoci]